MSNRQRAEQVIRDHGFDPCREPECIAQDLADAGLLAPELPEPSRGMFPRGAVWYLAGPIGDIRRTGDHIVIFGHDYRRRPFRVVLDEAETETIARVLLAASNYDDTKKGNNNGPNC